MQGHREGLTGRLRTYCRHVLTMNCAAHKHVLAVQDIAGESTLLELLDQILRSVYTLFNRKSKRVALWDLFARKRGVTALSLPLLVKTRWFSRAACVRGTALCLASLHCTWLTLSPSTFMSRCSGDAVTLPCSVNNLAYDSSKIRNLRRIVCYAG